MVLRGIEPRSRPRQGRVLAIGQQDLRDFCALKIFKYNGLHIL